MAPTRTTPKTSARSSPRSGKSTPTAKTATGKKRSTPLKQSTTPASAKSKSKSKPVKTPTPAKGKTPQSRVKLSQNTIKVKDNDEESARSHSPTGLTETEDDSSSSDGDSEDAFDPSSANEEIEDEPIESDSEVDSDFLDEEEDVSKKKRKSLGGGGGSGKKAKDINGNVKSRGVIKDDQSEEEEEFDDEVELEEGQEIAGRIYPAPKTGQVPPGQISQNTFSFLKNLQNPAKNDRDWFRSHEPAFRQAEKEWQAFVAKVQKKFSEADNEIPVLPPKDVIHRIYRDVRFSSDKTPYKKSFSLSTSRGGRKGLWAGYHLSISPNQRSILACGVWQPGKNELATIRHHFLTEPQRFRDVIEHEDFVKLFGPAKVGKKGTRQNVFGHDDALKVAPKGIDKGHKDIDLLKLRSVAVVHKFTDEEVLSEGFMDKVKEVVVVMTPFVHLLNEFISLPDTNGGNNTPNGNANGNDVDDDE